MLEQLNFKAISVSIALVASSICMPSQAFAGIVNVGEQISTFASSSGWTRGFFFETPEDIVITGVGYPTDAGNGNFSVAVLEFESAPPVYASSTNDFSTVFLAQDVSGVELLDTNLFFEAGSLIGVLGIRNGVNSYSTSNFLSDIGGTEVTLTRIGMQFDLSSTGPRNIWQEANYQIGRVTVEYELADVSEPASLALLGLGLAGLFAARRRLAR